MCMSGYVEFDGTIYHKSGAGIFLRNETNKYVIPCSDDCDEMESFVDYVYGYFCIIAHLTIMSNIALDYNVLNCYFVYNHQEWVSGKGEYGGTC